MQSYPSPNAGAGDSGAPFYSSSAQQQPGIPNSDELQLTAQLSRGLAPIMNAGPGGNMTDSQDPRGPSQGSVNHQYEHEQVQVHPAQMQQSHGSMDQMGGQYGTPDGSMAPRKRSKVSRACDECRRKKIRCDATGEGEGDQCSSCKRIHVVCQFSRVPMKRGPSKGYIKELADRLNTLEGVMHAGEASIGYPQHHESPTQRRPSEEFSPPPNTDSDQRKRTYSAVSNEFGSYLPQRNFPGWSPSDPSRSLTQPQPGPAAYPPQSSAQTIFREPIYSPNGLPPMAHWRQSNAPEAQRMFDGPQEINAERVLDWNDDVVDRYYQYIHPAFRLLQSDKARLRDRIGNAPVALREAFYEALDAAVRSFTTSNHQAIEQQGIRKAAQILTSTQFENTLPRSLPTDMIYLQTLFLLAIATNNDPSIALQPQFKLMKSTWLAIAVELAYSMKLHQYKKEAPGDDPDSDEKLARRLWWALVTLDRLSASSTGRPALIPDDSITIYPEDELVLGDTPYQLARMSIVLEHIAQVILRSPEIPALALNPHPIYGTLLRGELERVRESLPPSVFPPTPAPLVHLYYWHLRVLVELTLADSFPEEMLRAAMHIVTQVTHNGGLLSPLVPYCTVLAVLALIELLEHESLREEAERGLNILLEGRIAHLSWDAAVRELITNRLQRPSSALLGMSTAESKHASVASQSLQRLADLATATEEGRDVAGSEERKEGGEKSASASGLAAAPSFQHYATLRGIVRNGFLYGLSGESTR